MKNLINIFIFISMLFGVFSLSGMIVRNIHHPIFASIKDEVIFIVDLPKEIHREFFQGLETTKPFLPNSVRKERFNQEIIPESVIYQHNGKVFKNGKILENAPYKGSTFFINKEISSLLSLENGYVIKYDISKDKERELWRYSVPFWHHKKHVDEAGNIYSPTYFPNNGDNGKSSKIVKKLEKILENDNSPPYDITGDNFRDDGVIVLSPNGKVLHKIGLTDLFEKNNLLHLVYGSGLETDAFHLNSVSPAKINKGIVKKGDLLLSLRHQSMLLIYRPSTLEIIWYKVGPWLNQHSAKFDDNGDIYLFDNAVIETHYARRRETGFIDGQNNILKHVIETNETSKINICIDNKDIWTVTEGEVFIGKESLYLNFENTHTKVICNKVTGYHTFMLPNHQDNGRVVPDSQYIILNYGS